MSYQYRYPPEYERFTDHSGAPAHVSEDQLPTYNAYDNAVLYNDFVVSSLIKRFAATDPNGFLFYLADHGEAVFDAPKAEVLGRNEAAPTDPMYTIRSSCGTRPGLAQSPVIARPGAPLQQLQPGALPADLAGLDFAEHDRSRSLVSNRFKARPLLIGDPQQPQNLIDFSLIRPKPVDSKWLSRQRHAPPPSPCGFMTARRRLTAPGGRFTFRRRPRSRRLRYPPLASRSRLVPADPFSHRGMGDMSRVFLFALAALRRPARLPGVAGQAQFYVLSDLGSLIATSYSVPHGSARMPMWSATAMPASVPAFIWTAGAACRTSAPWAAVPAMPMASMPTARWSAMARKAGVDRAFLWSADGGFQLLGTRRQHQLRREINDAGQVAGYSQIASGKYRAYRWSGGGHAEPRRARQRQQQQLRHRDQRIRPGGRLQPCRQRRACLPLGPEPRPAGPRHPGRRQQLWQAIGASGAVVGYASAAGAEHAFVWTSAGGLQDLGTLGGANSYAKGVNAQVRVVGQADTASGAVGFVWSLGEACRTSTA